MAVERPPSHTKRLESAGRPPAGIGHNTGFRRSMYAITFDMDTTALQASYTHPPADSGYLIGFARRRRPTRRAVYPDSDEVWVYHDATWQNACNDIGKILHGQGFGRQQGSVYFGDDTVDAVRCVLAVQALARAYVGFSPSVRDIRMLRIEDNNDLMPAVAAVIS